METIQAIVEFFYSPLFLLVVALLELVIIYWLIFGKGERGTSIEITCPAANDNVATNLRVRGKYNNNAHTFRVSCRIIFNSGLESQKIHDFASGGNWWAQFMLPHNDNPLIIRAELWLDLPGMGWTMDKFFSVTGINVVISGGKTCT